MVVPEIGQYVIIRRRPAIVRNQIPFQDGQSGHQHHFIDIEYIDGYDYPTEDRIIWELEINQRAFHSLDFPTVASPGTAPDKPAKYEAFLNALKWSSNCICSYERGKVSRTQVPFLGPWYSAIQTEDYQLYPVLKAMEMPKVNLLLADDVGLGKTIEAGLILQELIRQRRLRRILILCPSSLQIQWQDEMKEKFNVDFTVVDSDQVYDVQRELGVDANPWTVYPKVITSMDYLKQPDVLSKFITGTQYVLPEQSAMLPWDLLIVDEAHNFTPSKFNDDSRRCAMLRDITPYFEHRLFLTATPHNGYTLSFSGLMELLDPIRFQQKNLLDEEDAKHLRLIMIRRMKSELNAGRTPPRFPRRSVDALEIALMPEEARLYQAMRDYRFKGVEKLKGIGKRERHLAGFILTLLTKRLLSSSYAFARTWWNHVEGLDLPDFGYDEAYESMERAETPVDDDSEKERRETDAIRHGAGWLAQYKDVLSPYVKAVSAELTNLGWSKEAMQGGLATLRTLPPDRKWEGLMAWVRKNLMAKGGFRKDERVIIFTEYKDTLEYLLLRFQKDGVDAPALQVLFGGSDARHRRIIKFQFNDPMSPLRILLATDVASEGLNLQTSCRYVIHQEIPWNPMRLEQRNGRVDRHGQSRDVTAYHFKSDQDEDLKFLDFVARKVNTVREDLGSTGMVLDEAITEHFETGRMDQDEVDRRIERYRSRSQDKKDLDPHKLT